MPTAWCASAEAAPLDTLVAAFKTGDSPEEIDKNALRWASPASTPCPHKGLGRLYHTGSKKGVQPAHVPKLLRIMSALDVAQVPDDLAIPSFRTHQLKGDLAGHWSIGVNGNWRVTFKFIDGDVELVDYQDYQ